MTLTFILVCFGASQWVTMHQSLTEDKLLSQDSWKIFKPKSGQVINTCGDLEILGGYRTFGSQTILSKQISAAPHWKLKVSFKFYQFTNWISEKLLVQIDDKIDSYWVRQTIETSCSGQQLLIESLELVIGHRSPSPVFFLSSDIEVNDNAKSWGMRGFVVEYLPCPDGCSFCGQQTCFFDSVVVRSESDGAREGWSRGNSNAQEVDCLGLRMLGSGGQSELSRRILNIPPHYKVLVRMQIWFQKIDPTLPFLVMIDDITKEQVLLENDQLRLCDYDLVQYIESAVGHTLSEMHLVLSYGSSMSWAMRDFEFQITSCGQNCVQCTSEGECLACGETHVLNTDKDCVEEKGWYTFEQEFFRDEQFPGFEGWIFVGGGTDGNVTSQCGQTWLVGGSCVLSSEAKAKKAFRIPSHTKLRIRVQMWKIDEWQKPQSFYLTVDEEVWWQWRPVPPYEGIRKCGSEEEREQVIEVDLVGEHSREYAVVEVGVESQGGNYQCETLGQSWGFRELMIQYQGSKECALVYSECHFQGEEYELCDERERSEVGFAIRSVKVGRSVELLRKVEGMARLEESVECLEYMIRW